MGLKKSLKRSTRKFQDTFKKSLKRKPGMQLARGVKKYTKGAKGDYDDSEDDYRSEAAGQLVSENVTRQAGAGQISYTNEYKV